MDSRLSLRSNENQFVREANNHFNGIWTTKFSHADPHYFMHSNDNFLNLSPQCPNNTTDLNSPVANILGRAEEYNSKLFETQIAHDGNNNNTISTVDANAASLKDSRESFSLSTLTNKPLDDLSEDSLVRNNFSYSPIERSDLKVSLSDQTKTNSDISQFEHKFLNDSTASVIKRDIPSPSNGSLTDEKMEGDGGMRMSECVVCGDKSSGKHYGQYTCEGCKSFFKRSVRRELSYSCRGNRGCRVDMQHRNQCQYCRYQKCLKMGMRKEAVQRGRIPSGAFNGYVSLPSYTGRVSSGLSPVSWPDLYSHSTPNPQRSTTSSASANLLAMILKAENCSGTPPVSTENASDHSCQILLSIVEWARRIPHFLELHFTESATLLTNCWHELFLMNFLQLGLTNSLFNVGLNSNIFLDSMQARLVQDQLDRFSKINLDPMEFACLKCLILFNPDSVGLSEISLVESIQERIQIALEEHTRASYPTQRNRLPKLLLRLPAFRALPPHFIEQLFFSRQLSTGKGSVETIIRDILLGYSAQLPASIYTSNHQGGGNANHQISPLMTHQSGQQQFGHSWGAYYTTPQSHATIQSGES